MRLIAEKKSEKINKALFSDLKKMAQRIKAGYPAENPQTHAKDKNGFSALEKAIAINISDKNFRPYLQISYTKNKIKYQKTFINIIKMPPNKQEKALDLLGKEMVTDIKGSLAQLKLSPLSTSQGNIYGAISFIRVKK